MEIQWTNFRLFLLHGVVHCLLHWNVTNTQIEIQFSIFSHFLLQIHSEVHFVYRYKFVANGNTFVIVCNHIIVCDKRIYMYSTYWYTITLPWKFYIVREHIFLYWMCCLNRFDRDNFFLNISFIFKKFCRWLNVHKNICVHVLIYVYEIHAFPLSSAYVCVWTRLVSFQLISFRYMCTTNCSTHVPKGVK